MTSRTIAERVQLHEALVLAGCLLLDSKRTVPRVVVAWRRLLLLLLLLLSLLLLLLLLLVEVVQRFLR